MKMALLTLLAVSGMVFSANAKEKEEEIALDKLPAKVLETVKKKYPKGTLIKAVKEEEDNEVEYEVTLKDDGAKIEISIDEKGEIESIEKEIDAKTLPKEVTEAVEKKYPKATYKLVEAVYEIEDDKEELEYYEIELTAADKKEVEIKIKANGKIVEVEEEAAK